MKKGMKFEGPDTKVKGGPVKPGKKVSFGGEKDKLKKFSFEGPDRAGGGWVGGKK